MRALAVVGACLLGGCGLELGGLADPGTSGDDGASEGRDAGGVVADAGSANEDAARSTIADGAQAPDATKGASPDAAAEEDAQPAGPGDALQFGSGAYVEIGLLPLPSDFTLEAWVKPSTGLGEMEILAEDRNGQTAGQFRLGLTSGKPFFMMTDAAGNSFGLFANLTYALEAPQALPLATWSHVAVTKSGAAFALFVGQNQVATFTATGALAAGAPTLDFRIAARVALDGTSADSPFDGAIDEVRIWSIARAPADIASTMSETVSPTRPSLADYWRFDDGSGLAALDEEGRYPGTLVGGPVWVVLTAF